MMAEGRNPLDHAMAAGSSGTWEWDIGTDELWIDERFAELFGLDNAQARVPLPTSTFFLRIHPADKRRMRIAVAGMLGGSENFSKEFRIEAPDGSVRWMHGRGQTVLGASDEPLRFTGLLVDVTDRKRAEERLRIAQKAGGIGTFEYIDGFATVAVSEEFCRLLGLFPAPALPLPTINKLLIDGHEPLIPQQIEQHATELTGEFLVARSDDGQSRWIARRGEIVREGSLGGFRLIGVIYDISMAKSAEQQLRELNETLEVRVQAEIKERLGAEEALRQAQKMEAVGHLTGGVAHDFNNLLTIVVGNIESLQRHMPASAPDRIRRSAENAMQGAKRAATLTQRLLAFSRRQPLDPKPLDANKLVSGMSDLMTRTLGESVEVETVLSGGLWRIEVDPNQLESAILNLAVNARDAMSAGGKLTIETANAYLDEAYAATAAEVVPGQYVVIAVSDTGMGMPKDVLDRVFEPFYTTKPTGHGTGLGLSQVYGFVKQSGGHVKIYSELGEGTTVKIYLSRFLGKDAEEEVASTTVPDGAKKEIILVVEDDNGVRQYTVEILRELGYTVIEAHDGPSALRRLNQAVSVDLLFTDVGLPGMTGRQLADEACKRLPGLKVLFTTGYARNAIVHHGRLDPGVEMIGKPFTYAGVAAKIRDALDGKG